MSDTTVSFTAGRREGAYMGWQEAPGTPTVTISLVLFRAIFDAAGEETIDTTGDIDPGTMLDVLGIGNEAQTRRGRVCGWSAAGLRCAICGCGSSTSPRQRSCSQPGVASRK